jgi:hypothetical protein
MSSVTHGYDYVAGTHKSDTVPLDAPARVRVHNPTGSGVTVTLAVKTQRGEMTLEFPEGFCDWEPVWITQILDTGTSEDTASGVVINLGVA